MHTDSKTGKPLPSSPGLGARRAGASRRPCAAPHGPRGPSGPRARGAGGPEDRKDSTAALPNPCASVCIRGEKCFSILLAPAHTRVGHGGHQPRWAPARFHGHAGTDSRPRRMGVAMIFGNGPRPRWGGDSWKWTPVRDGRRRGDASWASCPPGARNGARRPSSFRGRRSAGSAA